MKCPPRCSGHLQRKHYFGFCKSGRAAAPPDLLFHGRGRYGKWHRLLLACGQSAEGQLAFCGKESRNVPPGAMSFRYQMPLPAMTPLVKRQLRKICGFSGVAFSQVGSQRATAFPVPPPFREQVNGKRPQSFPIDKKKIHSSGYGAAHAEPFSIVLVFISLPASSGCGSPAGCAAGRCSPRSAPAHWGCGPAARSMRSHRRCAAPAS